MGNIIFTKTPDKFESLENGYILVEGKKIKKICKELDEKYKNEEVHIFRFRWSDQSNETLVLWCPKIYCGLYPYGDAFHGLFLLVSRKRDEQHESSCHYVPRVFA